MSLKGLFVVGAMVCVASTAVAASLADAARLEAERRAKLASASPAPVFTQENVASSGNGGTFTQMTGPKPRPYRPDGRTMSRRADAPRSAPAPSRAPAPSPLPTPPGSQPVPKVGMVCQEGARLGSRIRGTAVGERVCTPVYNPYDRK